MRAALEARMAKNRASREVRSKRLQRENPARALFREWSSEMKAEFGTTPRWGGAEYSLAKKLVSEEGFDEAAEIVRHFIKTWKKRRTSAQERRDELPPMKLCWSLRERLKAEIDGVVRIPTSKRERVLRGEYDDEAAQDAPTVGWG